MSSAGESARQIIKWLDLKPHPEGGFFTETYRCHDTVPAEALPRRYSGNRNLGTAIYFLLTSRDVSLFHRLQTDEIWHFYDGSPLILHFLHKNGIYETHKLGVDIDQAERPQIAALRGSWFGATVARKESFSLVGCTTAPGFDFADFELAERRQLLAIYPQHADIIKKLTPAPDQ